MGFNPKTPGRGGSPPGRGGSQPAGGQTAAQLQYPLPPELAAVYRSANKSSLNPAVIFDRYAPDLSRAENNKEAWKKQALQAAAVSADAGALRAYIERWRALTQAAGAQSFTMQTDWRFIPGLGRKSALEIGFGFHRYGFPYLPGSAVKGIARTWALFELAEAAELPADSPEILNNLDQLLAKPAEEFDKELKNAHDWRGLAARRQEAERFRMAFGALDQAGGAVFFEAIPAKAFPLEIDIMNPHFGPYYQGKDAPADWHNPVPVAFLTVPAGQPFHFAVGWRGGSKRAEWLNQAAAWLRQGLKELGAGAKTAAGYGYFK